jgi:hypothetical protein
MSENLTGTWEAWHASLYASLHRNDPKISEVRLRDFGRRGSNHVYGRLLGEALQGNTHVSHLQLPVSTDCIAPDKFSPPHRDHIALLLSYIRSGPALRDVHLEGRGALKYMGYLIDAVADSPHVVNFNIDLKLKYPPQAMGRLLATNKNLKRLSVAVVKSKGILSKTLKLNRTIEHLILRFWNKLPAAEEAEVIQGLRDHESLEKLDLMMAFSPSHVAMIGALSSVLPSLLSLTDLSLKHNFVLEEMELLLEGLYTSQSIVKLSLRGRLATPAAVAFVEYMQTRNGVGANGITSLRLFLASPLRSGWCDPNILVGDLLKGPRESGLQLLNWTVVSLFHGRPFHRTKRPRCLQFIPKLLHLRELEIQDCHMMNHCVAFCNAVKKNASLYKVLVTECKTGNKTVSFEGWDDKLVHLIKACGDRNRHLPQLLANPNEVHGESDPHSPSMCRGRFDEATKIKTRLLVPALLCVSQQTPRMALNHLFQGLLALNVSVGPRLQAPLRTAPM